MRSVLCSMILLAAAITSVAGDDTAVAPAVEVAKKHAVRLVAKLDSGGRFGSGSIVSPAGLILTCRHVVEGMKAGVVEMPSGVQKPFEVLHRGEELDYAILLIRDPVDVPPLRSCDVAAVEEGMLIYSRCGLSGGSLCSIRGSLAYWPDDPMKNDSVVQMPLTPGSSGAPLFDRDGRLLGHALGMAKEGAEGFPKLLLYERVVRDLQGVEAYRDAVADCLGVLALESDTLRVADAGGEAPAADPGGTVTQLNDWPVATQHDLRLACWAAVSRGLQRVRLTIQGPDGIRSVDVATSVQPPPPIGFAAPPQKGDGGLFKGDGGDF